MVPQIKRHGKVFGADAKRLGQYFLTDERVLAHIAAMLKAPNNATVIEIGPGTGALTTHIATALTRNGTIIAIEKDPVLAEALPRNVALPGQTVLTVVCGDARKTLHTIVARLAEEQKEYYLIGNIPYYITGTLLRSVGELSPMPIRVVLTVQREVAERLAATAPQMNLLSASVAYWGNASVLCTIPRNAFTPMPQVDSATVLIVPKKHHTPVPEEIYYPFIRLLFKQPRKTVLNNLTAAGFARSVVEHILQTLGHRERVRPQALSFEDILRLVASVQSKNTP